MKELIFLSALLFSLSHAACAASQRHIENLSEENQKRIRAVYSDLLYAHEKNDFEKMSGDARSILSQLDDYKDTKAYAAIAERGLERAKQEKDPESQKRRDRALHDLAALEIKGQAMLVKAKTDPDARTELYKTMNEILALDPANTYPAEWRQKLHAE